MPLSAGQVLHQRYRIVKLIGQGGFGAVYRAWDTALNQPCAVKENLDTSPEAQRQFQREATILASLRHPNLPRVTDHFFVPGQGQYLVMDFVEGQSQDEIMHQKGRPLTEQEALPWIEQVCQALDYLHRQQQPIIHRDIKPQNIIVTRAGQAMPVDFGISKVYDPLLSTTTGAQAVTPGFSPPEQYGQGRTDARSDVYALGATLYALLTCQTPPDAIDRLVHGVPLTPPRQVNRQVSLAVDQAIMKALEVDTKRRLQSATDFQASLKGPGGTPPIPQPMPTPAPPLPPVTHSAARPRRVSWLAIAGIGGLPIVLALILLASLTAWLLTRNPVQVTPTIPTVFITSPLAGSQVPINQPIIVNATASDPNGITRVELWVGGNVVDQQQSALAEGQSTFPVILRWTPSVGGSYTLEVRAYNRPGIANAPTTVMITVVGEQGAPGTLAPTLPSPTPMPGGPPGAILTSDLNVREGPGQNYPTLGLLPVHTQVEVTGRNPDGTWWQIVYPPGGAQRGWIYAPFTRPSNTENVPVVWTAVPPTPIRVPAVQSPVPSTPTPTPHPISPSVQRSAIGPIVFATGVTDDSQPVGAGTTFSEDIQEIHAVFSYEGMSEGDAWERRWFQDGEEVGSGSGVWDSGESGTFDLSLTGGGEPLGSGTWKLEIYVNGELAQSGTFVIQASATPTNTPAPRTGRIAFARWDGGKHNLFIANADPSPDWAFGKIGVN
jgi:serine/threonine protein kinase